MVIYGLDEKIVRLNDTARHLLGYRPSDGQLTMAERGVHLHASLVDAPDAGPEQMPAARALRGEIVRGALMALHPMDRPDSPRPL